MTEWEIAARVDRWAREHRPELVPLFELVQEYRKWSKLKTTYIDGYLRFINPASGRIHPDLLPLYRQIYGQNDLTYWRVLDSKVAEYAAANGFMYVIDEEPFLRNPTGKPIIINYFYHSQIKQSAKK